MHDGQHDARGECGVESAAEAVGVEARRARAAGIGGGGAGEGGGGHEARNVAGPQRVAAMELELVTDLVQQVEREGRGSVVVGRAVVHVQ